MKKNKLPVPHGVREERCEREQMSDKQTLKNIRDELRARSPIVGSGPILELCDIVERVLYRTDALESRAGGGEDGAVLAGKLRAIQRSYPFRLKDGAGEYRFTDSEAWAVNEVKELLPTLIEVLAGGCGSPEHSSPTPTEACLPKLEREYGGLVQEVLKGGGEEKPVEQRAHHCKLCIRPFVCDNGMWSTTCDCARTRPEELATEQKRWDEASALRTPPPAVAETGSAEEIAERMVVVHRLPESPYQQGLVNLRLHALEGGAHTDLGTWSAENGEKVRADVVGWIASAISSALSSLRDERDRANKERDELERMVRMRTEAADDWQATCEVARVAANAAEKERDAARAELTKVTTDRDGWKREYEMFANAWSRELGDRRRKTHLIDELVVGTRKLKERAEKAEAALSSALSRAEAAEKAHREWAPAARSST